MPDFFFFFHILNLFTYSTNQDQLNHLTQYNIGIIIEVVICPLRTSSTGGPTWLACDGSGSLHYGPGRIFELVDSTLPLLEESLRYYLLDQTCMKITVVVFHLLAVLCFDIWLWKIWQSHRDVTHWFCKDSFWRREIGFMVRFVLFPVRFWNSKIPYLDVWMVPEMANDWSFFPPRPAHLLSPPL